MCFGKYKLIYALSHGPCTRSNVPIMTKVVRHLDKSNISFKLSYFVVGHPCFTKSK